MSETIGIVYEISNNPFFVDIPEKYDDRLSEFVQPSEINKIIKAFKFLGYKVELIDGPSDLAKRHRELKKKCKLIFNKSIGFKGLERKIFVPAICQLYNLPYIGTSSYGLTLARHKYHTNRLLEGLGFKVPRAVLCFNGIVPSLKHLRFPIIVKPNHESDSLGITSESVFYNNKGIENQVEQLYQDFKQPIIIEEFIGGEEWKVAVLGNYPNINSLGCVGVKIDGKYISGSLQTREYAIKGEYEYYVPTNKILMREALKAAEDIHHLLELKDYSRIDFRIGENGKLYCLEVSTHPELNKNSAFTQSALKIFKSYEEVIRAILETATLR